MMDFTITSYNQLLDSLIEYFQKSYHFKYYIQNDSQLSDCLLLRHDVDRLPYNALLLAKYENMLGLKGSYYFRIIPESFNIKIIREIEKLGHEIGYHYEDVDLVIQNEKVKIKSERDLDYLIDKAFESFCRNLSNIRKIVDVKTICMHGSPLSKYDNRMIWEKYNYKELGIIGEPYYDIDFNDFAYFTDTGRRWNGNKFSIRDKVNSKYEFNFRTTNDIIANINSLPKKVMFTIHPERWTNNPLLWSKQYLFQNIKNCVKKVLLNKRMTIQYN